MFWSRLGFLEYHEGFPPQLASGLFSSYFKLPRPPTLRRIPGICLLGTSFVGRADTAAPAEQKAMDISMIRWVVSLPTPDITAGHSRDFDPWGLADSKIQDTTSRIAG